MITYPFQNFNDGAIEICICEWISNFLPYLIKHVIIHQYRYESPSVLVQGVHGVIAILAKKILIS